MDYVGDLLGWTNDVYINNNWPVIICSALIVLVIVWCWRRKRKHKRWYFWPLPLVLPLLILIAGSLVNNHFGLYIRLGELFDQYPFSTASAQMLGEERGNFPRGVTVVTDIPGTTSGVGAYPAFIWLPPQYFQAPTKKFPVVYLFPGTPGTAADWFNGGGAQNTGLANAQNGKPAIIASVSVGPDQLADTECVNGAQGNWQTYLAVDVPNYINSKARTLTGPKNQAVAGLSMGGYCAQALALRSPQKFGLFGNFSGSTMPTYTAGMNDLFGDPANLQATVNPYTSDWIIANQPSSRTVSGKVITGAQDSSGLLADEKQFVNKAQNYGMNVEMSTPPGSHEFYFWSNALQLWLPWALGQMGSATPVKN